MKPIVKLAVGAVMLGAAVKLPWWGPHTQSICGRSNFMRTQSAAPASIDIA